MKNVDMIIRQKLLLLLACCLWAAMGVAQTVLPVAQTVKSIAVGQGKPYTDHLALMDDSRDMDLMVKFVFDEGQNQLTVSLISYRCLFVFREDTRYKAAVKRRRLRPDQFPYMVEAEKGAKFKITKAFRRSVPKPRRNHVFRRWIEYDGLQPAPMEYKMVNDYIEQTFDIVGKRDFVTISLRDIMVMEKTGRKLLSKPDNYSVFFRRDLNTVYQVHLQRNPCFGLDEEMSAAVKARDAVVKAYKSLHKAYGSGVVTTEEALKGFTDMKALLQSQYEHNGETSPCPDIQQCRDDYNLYVDSIAQLKCVLQEPKPVMSDEGAAQAELEFDVNIVLSEARQIDNLVSRWMVSNDAAERHDIVKRCKDLINKTSRMLGNSAGVTPEQREAVTLFRAAERYFNATCGVGKK